MKRKHEEMSDEGDSVDFLLAEDVPFDENEVVIETSPSPDFDTIVYQDDSHPLYRNIADALEAQRRNMRASSPDCSSMRNGIYQNHIGTKLVKLKGELIAPSVDIIEAGKMVIFGNVDSSIENNRAIDKVVKSACNLTRNTGDIELGSLVSSLMHDSAIDTRFAMVGTSVMWNMLKANVRSVNQCLNGKVTAASPSDSKFHKVDIDVQNVPHNKHYKIIESDPFVEADLKYIFSLLTFRDSAKLLNKTKQFIKAYLIVACRPRCLIWRYTVRRSGTSHKKTIMDLPAHILETTIEFLLDATGIGRNDIPFDQLDQTTPFFSYLGCLEEEKKFEYIKACHNRDNLMQFFRNAVTDCLNEIREMPFSLETGSLTSPLRGRPPNHDCITWKQFESVLKNCGDNYDDVSATCDDVLEAVITSCYPR